MEIWILILGFKFNIMPSIDYIKIIKDAWKITWNNRYLWWLGLIVGIANFGGMNYNFGSGNEKGVPEAFQKISGFVSSHMQWIIIAASIFLAIIIIFTILSIIARAGLIKSVDDISKGGSSSFRSALREGKKYFWKIFALGLLIFFLVAASIFILAIPVIFLIASKSYGLGIFLGIIAFFILIPILILSGFLNIYGQFYIVLGKLSVWDSIENAYDIFRKNILSSIIMSLFFIPISIVVFAAIAIVFIVLAIIFILVGLAFYALFSKAGAIVAASIGLFIFLLIILAIKSVYEVFAQTAWYLFFSEIAKPRVEEKIEETVSEGEKEEKLPAPEPVKTAEIED